MAAEILSLYNPLGNTNSPVIIEHKRTLAAKIKEKYNNTKLGGKLENSLIVP